MAGTRDAQEQAAIALEKQSKTQLVTALLQAKQTALAIHQEEYKEAVKRDRPMDNMLSKLSINHILKEVEEFQADTILTKIDKPE